MENFSDLLYFPDLPLEPTPLTQISSYDWNETRTCLRREQAIPFLIKRVFEKVWVSGFYACLPKYHWLFCVISRAILSIIYNSPKNCIHSHLNMAQCR